MPKTTSKIIGSLSKLLKELVIYLLTWLVLTLVMFYTVLQPTAETDVENFYICAFQHYLSTKNSNHKMVAEQPKPVHLKDYQANRENYLLCQNEAVYSNKINTMFLTMRLIDKEKNEWEFQESSDSIRSPFVYRYRISSSFITPSWYKNGFLTAWILSILCSFFLAGFLLHLANKGLNQQD